MYSGKLTAMLSTWDWPQRHGGKLGHKVSACLLMRAGRLDHYSSFAGVTLVPNSFRFSLEGDGSLPITGMANPGTANC